MIQWQQFKASDCNTTVQKLMYHGFTLNKKSYLVLFRSFCRFNTLEKHVNKHYDAWIQYYHLTLWALYSLSESIQKYIHKQMMMMMMMMMMKRRLPGWWSSEISSIQQSDLTEQHSVDERHGCQLLQSNMSLKLELLLLDEKRHELELELVEV